jgi:hypothetical protein
MTTTRFSGCPKNQRGAKFPVTKNPQLYYNPKKKSTLPANQACCRYYLQII